MNEGIEAIKGLIDDKESHAEALEELIALYESNRTSGIEYAKTGWRETLALRATQLIILRKQLFVLEELENGWEIWPQQHDAFKVDIDQHDISKSGNDIKITSDPYNGAWLFFPSQVKISEYQWLSFDIYSPSTEIWDPNKRNYSPIVINVVPMGYHMIASLYSANITHDSPFIEGGQLAAGKWQRVLIPLDAFGPILNPPFEHIVIENYSPNTITYYIDNIQLLKDKTGPN